MIHEDKKFNEIATGMDVHDVNGDRVGTVQSFRYGDASVEPDKPDLNVIQQLLEPLLNGSREFPEVIYDRMYREGFLRVQRGLLRSDVFVFAKEVESISGEDIHLNVDKDELLEG